jgi:hypothetical protein
MWIDHTSWQMCNAGALEGIRMLQPALHDVRRASHIGCSHAATSASKRVDHGCFREIVPSEQQSTIIELLQQPHAHLEAEWWQEISNRHMGHAYELEGYLCSTTSLCETWRLH